MFAELLAKNGFKHRLKKPFGAHVTALRSFCRCAAAWEFCVPLQHTKIVIFNRELPRSPSLAKLASCAAAD
jgi:hypothetical protein